MFTAAAGVGLAAIAIGNASGYYNIGVGWTAEGHGIWLGLVRMTFSFSAGLLISRVFKPIKIRGAFWLCGLLIVAVLSVPYVGGETMPVANGVYDAVCALLIFPAIVYLGASGRTTDAKSRNICAFLGAISYPLYIVHYPFMYLMYARAWRNGYGFDKVWPVAVCVIAGSIALAWLLMKYYDGPVRRWLSMRLLRRSRGLEKEGQE